MIGKFAMMIWTTQLAAGLWLSLLVASGGAQSYSSSALKASTTDKDLNQQQKRGKGLFLQRCSLCHLPKALKPRPDPNPPIGPVLNGLFKKGEPGKEAFVRELILKGSPNMPGFRYGLESSEIDDLTAYLKTL